MPFNENPYSPPASATTNETVRRIEPNIQIIAAALAASGTFYAIFAWIVPIFWPGYFVWGVWIAIAIGIPNFNRPWFWITSALWNFGMAALLLAETNWSELNFNEGILY